MNSTYIVNILNTILAYYCLFLILFGTISNLIAFSVCLRKTLIKTPTFVFYGFMLIYNTASLYILNIHYSLYALFKIQLLDWNIELCKIGHFLNFWFESAASWLLVSLVVERYISIRVILWRKKYFNRMKTIILCTVIVLLTFCIYIPILAEDVSKTVNATSPLDAFYHNELTFFMLIVHLFVYLIIPIPILIIFNSLLIYRTVLSSKTKIKGNKKGDLSLSVIISTTLFIVLNIANSVISAFYITSLTQGQYGFTITFFLNACQYTYLSANFYALLISNTAFKKELISGCLRNSRN